MCNVCGIETHGCQEPVEGSNPVVERFVKARYRAYLGVKPCGCCTAIMVDDDDTTAHEVAEFAKKMANSGRRLIHFEYDPEKTPCPLVECKCDQQ